MFLHILLLTLRRASELRATRITRHGEGLRNVLKLLGANLRNLGLVVAFDCGHRYRSVSDLEHTAVSSHAYFHLGRSNDRRRPHCGAGTCSTILEFVQR